jgi:hypothetical protein
MASKNPEKSLSFLQWVFIFVVALILLSGMIFLDPAKEDHMEVKWINHFEELFGREPLFSNNGTMYIWSWEYQSYNRIYCILPNGELYWTKDYYDLWAWTISPSGTIFIGGYINSTDTNSTIWALGPSGSQIWAFPFLNVSFYSIQLGQDGVIYTTFTGGVAAFSQDGELLWRLSPGPGPYNNLGFLSNNTLIYTTDGYLHGIGTNGSFLWRTELDTPVTITITDQGSIYSTLNLGHYEGEEGYLNGLYCYDLNGSVLWKYPSGMVNESFKSDFVQDPDGNLYFVGVEDMIPNSGLSNLYAVTRNGTFIWCFSQTQMTSPAWYYGSIVVSTQDGLKALDSEGDLLWILEGVNGWAIYSSNNQLYVIDENSITMAGWAS